MWRAIFGSTQYKMGASAQRGVDFWRSHFYGTTTVVFTGGGARNPAPIKRTEPQSHHARLSCCSRRRASRLLRLRISLVACLAHTLLNNNNNSDSAVSFCTHRHSLCSVVEAGTTCRRVTMVESVRCVTRLRHRGIPEPLTRNTFSIFAISYRRTRIKPVRRSHSTMKRKSARCRRASGRTPGANDGSW